MQYTRKDFLRIGGNMAAGLAIAPIACKLIPKEEAAKKLGAFGIQLWTLRDEMPKDPRGVLAQLAADGYKQIESFEGPKGIFWGMTNLEFKQYMDQLGTVIISSHCDIQKDFERKAAEAAAIGMKYLICPYKGPQKSIDDFKKFADEFNAKGEVCRKNGIRFAYHNHDYGFIPVDGQLPQKVMMDNTDPALVDFEMDIYWVVTAGHDPVEWMKNYPNRFRLCHVKDRIRNTTERDASCILGQGSIDFSKILKKAAKNGVQYYIVEQERYDNTTELASAKADADYMKMVKI